MAGPADVGVAEGRCGAGACPCTGCCARTRSRRSRARRCACSRACAGSRRCAGARACCRPRGGARSRARSCRGTGSGAGSGSRPRAEGAGGKDAQPRELGGADLSVVMRRHSQTTQAGGVGEGGCRVGGNELPIAFARRRDGRRVVGGKCGAILDQLEPIGGWADAGLNRAGRRGAHRVAPLQAHALARRLHDGDIGRGSRTGIAEHQPCLRPGVGIRLRVDPHDHRCVACHRRAVEIALVGRAPDIRATARNRVVTQAAGAGTRQGRTADVGIGKRGAGCRGVRGVGGRGRKLNDHRVICQRERHDAYPIQRLDGHGAQGRIVDIHQ